MDLTDEQKLEINKKTITELMEDDRYRYTLGFYSDRDGAQYGRKQLPDLNWKIKTLRIHPGGRLHTSHWRLSLITEDGKRTFFNNNVEYLLHGYGQMRVGPGNENCPEITFDIDLASHDKTLGDYLKVVLDPPADNYDGVFEGKPMCWFLYTNYVSKKTNLECRHWVQAVVRAFWHNKLLLTDPTPTFAAKNLELGYPDRQGECPKGVFFKTKPDPLQLTIKGNEEQARLANGEL